MSLLKISLKDKLEKTTQDFAREQKLKKILREEDTKKLTINIDRKLHEKFKIKAIKEKKEMCTILINFISSYLGKDTD